MIDKDSIIKCAILKGWNPVGKNISIHRSKNIYGGEWWIQQPESHSIRRVTDEELKSYLRDNKLKVIGV